MLELLAWRMQIFLEAQMGLSCDSHSRRCRCPQVKVFDCPHLLVLEALSWGLCVEDIPEVSISTAPWGFYPVCVVNKHSLSVSLLL